MHSYSFQHTYNESGLYGEVGEILFPTVKLLK